MLYWDPDPGFQFLALSRSSARSDQLDVFSDSLSATIGRVLLLSAQQEKNEIETPRAHKRNLRRSHANG